MRGANETPPNPSNARGAIGFVLSADGTQLTYNGTISGMTPNAAHVHKGAAGVAGNVVYPLTFTLTTLSGVLNVTSGDVTDINNNNWYANVHSTTYPGGEIRDQLKKQ